MRTDTMSKPIKPTNEERLIGYLFQNWNSFSEREGVLDLNFTNGRNYINKLEKKLNIKFTREWEKTADGDGRYYRYSVTDRQTAEKLTKFANTKAQSRGAIAFSEKETNFILQQFS